MTNALRARECRRTKEGSCLLRDSSRVSVPIRLAKLARFLLSSAHYENHTSPTKKVNELLVFARVPSHSIRARLLCAFAASASDLSRRLFNER